MSIAPVLGFILFGFIPMLLAIYMAFCHLDGRTFGKVAIDNINKYQDLAGRTLLRL